MSAPKKRFILFVQSPPTPQDSSALAYLQTSLQNHVGVFSITPGNASSVPPEVRESTPAMLDAGTGKISKNVVGILQSMIRKLDASSTAKPASGPVHDDVRPSNMMLSSSRRQITPQGTAGESCTGGLCKPLASSCTLTEAWSDKPFVGNKSSLDDFFGETYSNMERAYASGTAPVRDMVMDSGKITDDDIRRSMQSRDKLTSRIGGTQ